MIYHLSLHTIGLITGSFLVLLSLAAIFLPADNFKRFIITWSQNRNAIIATF